MRCGCGRELSPCVCGDKDFAARMTAAQALRSKTLLRLHTLRNAIGGAGECAEDSLDRLWCRFEARLERKHPDRTFLLELADEGYYEEFNEQMEEVVRLYWERVEAKESKENVWAVPTPPPVGMDLPVAYGGGLFRLLRPIRASPAGTEFLAELQLEISAEHRRMGTQAIRNSMSGGPRYMHTDKVLDSRGKWPPLFEAVWDLAFKGFSCPCCPYERLRGHSLENHLRSFQHQRKTMFNLRVMPEDVDDAEAFDREVTRMGALTKRCYSLYTSLLHVEEASTRGEVLAGSPRDDLLCNEAYSMAITEMSRAEDPVRYSEFTDFLPEVTWHYADPGFSTGPAYEVHGRAGKTGMYVHTDEYMD